MDGARLRARLFSVHACFNTNRVRLCLVVVGLALCLSSYDPLFCLSVLLRVTYAS